MKQEQPPSFLIIKKHAQNYCVKLREIGRLGHRDEHEKALMILKGIIDEQTQIL
jgi:hypothetical protein